jgi:hypothetical protein
MNYSRKKTFLLRCVCLVLLQSTACLVRAATPLELLQELDDYPHAQVISSSDEQVLDYELGLGSIKKVRGVWRFKNSERKTGYLQTYTWQIVDGFSSEEVMQSLQESLEQDKNASVLFACDGRSCGQGAQWANRVFHQRVLYGREDLQRYRIYSLQGSEGTEYRLVIYSAARTADRQYLHVELLQIEQ